MRVNLVDFQVLLYHYVGKWICTKCFEKNIPQFANMKLQWFIITLKQHKENRLESAYQKGLHRIPSYIEATNYNLWKLKITVTVYCIICGQRIYQKAFLNWLYQYLSFLNIFSIDFTRWKIVGTPHIPYILIH